MTTLVEALEDLATALEADIPASPIDPKNQRLDARLEAEMARYFRKLAKAFPYAKIAALYNRLVEE